MRTFAKTAAWRHPPTSSLQGLGLEAKGQGLIVGDEGSYAKFSSLGLTVSAKDCERRFGETFATYSSRAPRPLRLFDGIDIVKALAGMGLADKKDVAGAINDTTRRRDEAAANAALLSQRQLAKAVNATLEQTPAANRDDVCHTR